MSNADLAPVDSQPDITLGKVTIQNLSSREVNFFSDPDSENQIETCDSKNSCCVPDVYGKNG